VKFINIAILAALGLTVTTPHADEVITAEQPQNSVDPNSAEHISNDNNTNMERTDMNVDKIDAKDFVETASAKGIAEVELAKLALKDGTSVVRSFAEKIIKDHTKANNELKAIAAKNNLEISDDATLMDRAKAMIMSVRDGESFDEAYIKNQIKAHEEAIKLFESGSISDNTEIQAFARNTLPTLREHLQMAKVLKMQQGF
jgi:putative membrane protein